MLKINKDPREYLEEIKKHTDAILEAFELIKDFPVDASVSFDYSQWMWGHIYPTKPLTKKEIESILDWFTNFDIEIRQSVSESGEPFLITRKTIKLSNDYTITLIVNGCKLKSCKLIPEEVTKTRYKVVCS